MAGSRGNGEGSIYQSSSDGRWLGSLTMGYGPNGKSIRETVSAKTRTEVVKKMKLLQRQFDDGIPLPDATLMALQSASQAAEGLSFREETALPKITATEASARGVDRSMQLFRAWGSPRICPLRVSARNYAPDVLAKGRTKLRGW